MGINIVIYDAVGLKNMCLSQTHYFFIEIISFHLLVDLNSKTQTHMFILISIWIVANYKMYGLFHTKWLILLGKYVNIANIYGVACLMLMSHDVLHIFQIHSF